MFTKLKEIMEMVLTVMLSLLLMGALVVGLGLWFKIFAIVFTFGWEML